MKSIIITLDERDTAGDAVEEIGELEQVVFLEGHSASGQPVIEVVLRRADGTRIAATTSMRLWRAMSAAFEGRLARCDERTRRAVEGG